MRQLSELPNGKAKVRSVKLEPHLDQMVHQHMKAHGYASLSAALRDIVDRGLATLGFMGPGADQKSRAYREALVKVEAEARREVRDALTNWAARNGASAPSVLRSPAAAAAKNSTAKIQKPVSAREFERRMRGDR